MAWTSSEPIADFLTGTTYGSWLPGDERGWVERPGEFRAPDASREDMFRRVMTESICSLNADQRRLVEETIHAHCLLRSWQLHVVNCRTQHVHAVISAPVDSDRIQRELKAWCTRRLKELERTTLGTHEIPHQNWWTERGSKRPVFDEDGLEATIIYVRDCQ